MSYTKGRPEKKDLNEYKITDVPIGYNKACEEWEAYHKEVIAELLEACKETLSWLRKCLDIMPDIHTDIVIAKAEQAIAKAGG